MRPYFSLAVALVLCLPALARQIQQTVAGTQANETCAFNFMTGTGHGLTQYCVTNNGNITQFSAVGGNTLTYEFLNGTGAATEGYGMCDTTNFTPLAYWDFASSDSGNWNVATAVQSGNKVTVTRTTADGIWQLVQTIRMVPGSKFTYGGAEVIMAAKNLSLQDRFLFITRYADVNAGSSTFNDFGTTEVSAWGIIPDGNGPGLSMTAGFVTTPFDFSLSFVETVPAAPIPCQINSNSTKGFFEGDGGIAQDYSLEIGPGRTKTVGLIYKPF